MKSEDQQRIILTLKNTRMHEQSHRGWGSNVEQTLQECPEGDSLIHTSLPDICSLLGFLQFVSVVLLHLPLQTQRQNAFIWKRILTLTLSVRGIRRINSRKKANFGRRGVRGHCGNCPTKSRWFSDEEIKMTVSSWPQNNPKLSLQLTF